MMRFHDPVLQHSMLGDVSPIRFERAKVYAILIGCALVAVGVSARAQTAQPRLRDFVFRSDTVQLSGTLVSPPGAGRHPAIVFIHASGPMTRDAGVEYARTFARIGLVGLAYDKRGTGKSTGSWVTASPNDLTTDVLSAIALLKTQPNVDTTRIGIWGVSQAGWPAARAAARSRDVAFLVLISAGGVSPRESELFAYRNLFARLGTRADTAATAMTTLTMYMDYLDTGRGRAALDAAVARATSAPWNLAIRLHEKMPTEATRTAWQWLGSSAPEPIDSVRVPVLLMFGERDHEFPTALAVERWRQGLARAGNARATIVVFPGAGHGTRMRDGWEGAGRAPFADGYMELMLGWLMRHVVLSP